MVKQEKIIYVKEKRIYLKESNKRILIGEFMNMNKCSMFVLNKTGRSMFNFKDEVSMFKAPSKYGTNKIVLDFKRYIKEILNINIDKVYNFYE